MRLAHLMFSIFLIIILCRISDAAIISESHGIEMTSTTGAEKQDGIEVSFNNSCNTAICTIVAMQADEQANLFNCTIYNGSSASVGDKILATAPQANDNCSFNYRVYGQTYYFTMGEASTSGTSSYVGTSSFPFDSGYITWIQRVHNNAGGTPAWFYDTAYIINVERIYFTVSYGGADSNAPRLSVPICTSCLPNTNITADSTPTINVTCTDDTACDTVRISNISTQSFDQMTSSRDCTVGQGDTYVCTTIVGDAIPNGGILYFTASDTEGNKHTTWNLSIPITKDTIPPIIKIINPVNGNVYEQRDIWLNWSIDSAPDWCGYSLEGEINDSSVCPSGTPTNITMTSLTEKLHNVTIWANDSANNMGNSSKVLFTIDVPPTWRDPTANATGATVTNGTVQLNVTLSDGIGLDWIFIAHNNSGAFVNVSNVSISGKSVSFLYNITLLKEGMILWRYYFNDTYGHWNSTNLYNFTVRTSATVCTFNKHDNLTLYEYHTNVTINCTFGSIVTVDQNVDRFSMSADTGYEYLIDTLRENKFSDKSLSKILNFSTGWTTQITPTAYYCANWATPCTNIIDGNPGTYSSTNIAAFGNASLYANYSTVYNVTYIMQVKDGLDSLWHNLSLASCSVVPLLKFRTTSFINDTEGSNGVRWQCYTGSAWTTLRQVSDSYPSSTRRAYEQWLLGYRTTYWISMDNRTDVYNATINITGLALNGANPFNSWLNIGEKKLFKGTLYGNQLNINKVNDKSSVNLSYARPGQQYFYINISTVSVDGKHNINFTMKISGFNIDDKNSFERLEYFNDTNYSTNKINKTTSTATVPLAIYDDFENNVTSETLLWTETQICVPWYGCYFNVSSNGADDYYEIYSGNDQPDMKLTSNPAYLDLRNHSMIQLKVYLYNSALEDSYPGSCSGYYACDLSQVIYVTDGLNYENLYGNSLSVPKGGFSQKQFEGYIRIVKITDTDNWMVYKNNVYSNTISLANLDDRKVWKIQVYHSMKNRAGCLCRDKQIDTKLFDVRISGASLNRTNVKRSGYVTNQTYYSQRLFTAPENISSVIIGDVVKRVGATQNIRFEISNDAKTWKVALEDERTPFTNRNNTLYVRANLTTGVNTSSPVLISYTVAIIPGAAGNISIDIGNDGLADYTFNATLNSTTSPQTISLPSTPIKEYVANYCPGKDYCNIQNKLTVTDNGGIVQIDNINFTTYINPVSMNITHIDSQNVIPINAKIPNGALKLHDIKIDYLGSHDLQFSFGGLVYVLKVVYSKFNLSLPVNISWYDVFPKTRTSQNVSPYGQTANVPIFTINSLAYDQPFDVYLRTNATINSTINISYGINNSRYQFIYDDQDTEVAPGDIINYWNDFSLTHDGDWSTCDTPSPFDYVIRNFTAPGKAKSAIYTYYNGTAKVNYTLPEQFFRSKVRLFIQVNYPAGTSLYYLNNGTAWVNAFNTQTGEFCEDAIIWKEIQLLNTSVQKICSNVALNGQCKVWNYIDLGNFKGRFYLPWFFYSAICTDCVKTKEFWNTNYVVE